MGAHRQMFPSHKMELVKLQVPLYMIILSQPPATVILLSPSERLKGSTCFTLNQLYNAFELLYSMFQLHFNTSFDLRKGSIGHVTNMEIHWMAFMEFFFLLHVFNLYFKKVSSSEVANTIKR